MLLLLADDDDDDDDSDTRMARQIDANALFYFPICRLHTNFVSRKFNHTFTIHFLCQMKMENIYLNMDIIENIMAGCNVWVDILFVVLCTPPYYAYM